MFNRFSHIYYKSTINIFNNNTCKINTTECSSSFYNSCNKMTICNSNVSLPLFSYKYMVYSFTGKIIFLSCRIHPCRITMLAQGYKGRDRRHDAFSLGSPSSVPI